MVCVALSKTMASLGVSGRELDTGNKQRCSSVTSTCISVCMPLSATASLDEEAIGLIYRGFRGQCMKGRCDWEWTKSNLTLKKKSSQGHTAGVIWIGFASRKSWRKSKSCIIPCSPQLIVASRISVAIFILTMYASVLRYWFLMYRCEKPEKCDLAES